MTIPIVILMNTALSTSQLDRMAWTIANAGFETIPAAALRELGFEARQAGVHTAITNTLVDASAPLVVRQRAFGYIADKLSAIWNAPVTTPAVENCAA